MTEHFQCLEQEKRERVLNAGYQIFGKHGYRKASTADIAKVAGISKAMLFYYFVSKKELYLDLIQEASHVLLSAMSAHPESIPTDFFERLLALSHIKIQVLKKVPLPGAVSVFRLYRSGPRGLRRVAGIFIRRRHLPE